MASSAFELTDAQLARGNFAGITSRAELGTWIKTELDAALGMRGDIAQQIAYYWSYYEQGRTRERMPWPDAADLTSPYATEFVDAIMGRVMDSIMADPLWIVEGYGDSAKRAPIVEEFHQRAQEQERLQSYLREVILRSMIEPSGVLDVMEGVDEQMVRKTIRAALALNDAGAPIIGADGLPTLQKGQDGAYLEADSDDVPHAVVDIDAVEPVRVGPVYDVVPYLDFVRFPIHARTKSEIWGYGKRFWRRKPELVARAKRGIYDRQAVADLSEQDERLNYQEGAEPPPHNIVAQDGPTAQKELWELAIKADLDGKGARWWLLTLAYQTGTLLRIQPDDRSSRFLEFTPFPKPGSLDGYSLVEKMITLLEEDTAVRNMRADRASLAVSAPILKMQGSEWDPYDQPLSPGAVVTVRGQGELTPMVIPDVPQSINIWKNDVRADLERQIGLNDVSVGTQTSERRTLGEVRLAAGYSEVRVKAIITAIQETLEELGQVRHAIWIRTLEAMPKGLPAPSSLLATLDSRGVQAEELLGADPHITADLLRGPFWFKPRGSVETANLEAQAANFMGMLKTLPAIMQLSPSLKAIFGTPQAGKALMEQLLRVTRWPDKQAFLGSEAQRAMEEQPAKDAQAAEQQQMLQLITAIAGGAGQPQQGQMPQAMPQAMPAEGHMPPMGDQGGL